MPATQQIQLRAHVTNVPFQDRMPPSVARRQHGLGNIGLLEIRPEISIVNENSLRCGALFTLLTNAGLDVRTYSTAGYFLADFKPGIGCVIAPLQMTEMNGIAFLQALNQRQNKLPLIFIAGRTDVTSAVSAMKAGAADVLETPYSDKAIFDAIAGALQLGHEAQQCTAEMQAGRDLAAMLTPRERNVLDQIAKGRSNKVAAFELGISARTVEFHRARIMKKLNAQHCSDLVRAALAIERSVDSGLFIRP